MRVIGAVGGVLLVCDRHVFVVSLDRIILPDDSRVSVMTSDVRGPGTLAGTTCFGYSASFGCVASARVEGGVRTGGCLCGAVRYSVHGDPVHVRRCHCADCRKESGSAFTVYAHWPVEAFELSGEISSYDGRGFCPRCGSRLVDTADPGESLVEIRIGSLDEAPFELKPEDEIWVKRRESWIPPVEGAAQYAESEQPIRPAHFEHE
jgi:hypothetical protein